jgi:hypothetical protein
MQAIRFQMERIVALLLALAEIADRACLAPASLRDEVMALLLPAESVAREYVAVEAGLLASLAPADGDALDAAGLAVRLRFLALALAGVAARLLAECRLHEHARPSGALRNTSFAVNDTRWSAAPAPRPLDTS